tara:strand:+ start:1190 stop:1606 length:417 start_codon:yes stop_codon:yes gene_type:complete
MANEATLIHELELPIPFTCADGAGIEKGTLLKLTDPMTVALSDGAADIIAGISAEEKIANDGKTKIGVYLRGVFKMLSDGTVAVGAGVMADGTNPNEFITATAAADAAAIFGIALETVADGETGLVYVNVGIGGSPET